MAHRTLSATAPHVLADWRALLDGRDWDNVHHNLELRERIRAVRKAGQSAVAEQAARSVLAWNLGCSNENGLADEALAHLAEVRYANLIATACDIEVRGRPGLVDRVDAWLEHHQLP